MSQKWVRSKRWDDDHIPRWAWPVKFVLRAFSSITLAVILMLCVAVYGTLASVPVGLLALAPSWVIVGLTLVVSLLAGAAAPVVLAVWGLRRAGVGAAARFAAGVLLLLAVVPASVVAWHALAWPHLRYEPATGQGLRLFAGFVEKYGSTTLRRLPAFEMTELEFYGWWPLRLVLFLFITNMVVATLRRIEFTFKNIGVLTVHSGIVTIALGSVYYQRLKQEGDVVLMAALDQRGGAIPGMAGQMETSFYDADDPALWVFQRGWQERPLRGLPRYNDYGLSAAGVGGEFADDAGRTLELSPAAPGFAAMFPGGPALVDPDIGLRVVGFAVYADLEPEMLKAEPGVGEAPSPVEVIEFARSGGGGGEGGAGAQAERMLLSPASPADRVASLAEVMSVEAVEGMSERRFADLTRSLPPGGSHALVVEVPGAGGPSDSGFEAVYAARAGSRIVVADTGWTIEVEQLSPEPPLPIITPGYEGATSSVAVLRITGPPASGGGPARGFERYVYHRFPELDQDLSLTEVGQRGMPVRSAPDPAIRIAYLDASRLQVYIDSAGGTDESEGAGEGGGAGRVIVRMGDQPARVFRGVRIGDAVPILEGVEMRRVEVWPHGRRERLPVCVPPVDRDRESLGRYVNSAVAVRVSATVAGQGWERTVWLPFTQYLGISADSVRSVSIPDGREIALAFGRRRFGFPGLGLQLVDFEMIPYPHSDTPKDFRSDLIVTRVGEGGDGAEELRRSTSLNHPLLVRVSNLPRADVPGFVKAVAAVVGKVAPNQYKFSQTGWDASGWRQSAQLAAAGVVDRPRARWTILGVGNNPGIYVIAVGGVMMSVGIPWAFYVKPWLVRRERNRIKRRLERERASAEPADVGEGSSAGRTEGAAV